MSTSDLMARRVERVHNILNSINESLGEPRVAEFLGEDGTYAVPLGLRQGIAFTALHILDEAKKKPVKIKGGIGKLQFGRTPEEQKEVEEKIAAQRAKIAAKKAERQKKNIGRPAKKAKAPKVQSKKDVPPPPPPAAPGAAGALPVEKPKKAGKAAVDLEKAYIGKKGRKLTGAAALERLKQRIKAGEVATRGAEKAAKPIGGSLAALRRAGERFGEEAKGRVAKDERTKIFGKPYLPAGRRWEMRQPKYGELPSQFKAAQEKKTPELAWLEKERQRRQIGAEPARGEEAVKAKAGKLSRVREHEKYRQWLKGKKHAKALYHIDPDTGKEVHSTGLKKNKEFANATTFRDSDEDAMLHTDRSRKGSRGEADPSEFVFHGDVEKDPRQKWYRVSKEGGYASAMASLGKSYHKAPDMRSKVVQKVKSTGFVDSKGHQIDVRPTGALHNERGPCVKKKGGSLTALGKELKKRRPEEFYRLCKGAHGESGTKLGRSEYERGFKPQHDDTSKIKQLYRAARMGKAQEPVANIALHAAARPLRRADIKGHVRKIGRTAARFPKD